MIRFLFLDGYFGFLVSTSHSFTYLPLSWTISLSSSSFIRSNRKLRNVKSLSLEVALGAGI